MKKILYLSFAFLTSLIALTQTNIQKQQVLASYNKDLRLISAFGLKSASGGGPSNTFFYTPALEVVDVKNSGFLIREGYKFSKYNDQLVKEWEKEIDKTYGFSLDGPRGESLGDRDGVFFYEYTSLSSKKLKNFSITFFDPKGNPVKKEYKLEEKSDGVAGSFLNAKGLNVLLYKADKTTITYELLTFARQSLQMTSEILSLHSDPLEAIAYNKKFIYIGWKVLSREGNKTILSKAYFIPEDPKSYGFANENPDKKMVFKTVEIGTDNKIKNAKDFPAKSLHIEGNCLSPQLFLDVAKDEIYALETYLSPNGGYGGIYFLKSKYSTSENLKLTITTLNNPLNTYSDGTVIARNYEDPHDNKVTIYTPHKIVYYSNSGTFDFWNMNAAGFKVYEYLWTRLDNSANQLASATFTYNIGPGTLGLLSVFPKEITNFNIIKAPLKTNPLDFVFDLTKQIEVKNTAYQIVEKPDHYTIVTIANETGEFKAYKINK